jgi:bisphosphoglycerate-independent phosphoglycerate mutase (AlkP superfamily)
MQTNKAILVIMDGWGLGKVKSSDAIQNANTPFVSSLYAKYPNTTLTTCGELVGLPDGQMGNSEVGHLNLGAGDPRSEDGPQGGGRGRGPAEERATGKLGHGHL